MPAREPFVCGDRLEERRRLLVTHRKERELLAAVEEDDDPRRPAAELSARFVEEDRGVVERSRASCFHRIAARAPRLRCTSGRPIPTRWTRTETQLSIWGPVSLPLFRRRWESSSSATSVSPRSPPK